MPAWAALALDAGAPDVDASASPDAGAPPDVMHAEDAGALRDPPSSGGCTALPGRRSSGLGLLAAAALACCALRSRRRPAR